MKIEEVKKNLNKKVVYKGMPSKYKLTACILRKKDNKYYYQAELLDIKHGRSLLICGLEDIAEEG